MGIAVIALIIITYVPDITPCSFPDSFGPQVNTMGGILPNPRRKLLKNNVIPIGEIAEAFEQIVARTFWYVPEGPLVARVLDVAQRLAERVPVSRLASNLDHDVAARPWLDAGEPAVPSC